MPSIGKDLQKIRQHLGYSIEDIQHNTKIPVATLRQIESDEIFEGSEENLTYVRSFVRSYGRALKISDDLMIKALDQYETGNYNHLLLQQFPELSQTTAFPGSDSSKTVREESTSDHTGSESPEDYHEEPEQESQSRAKSTEEESNKEADLFEDSEDQQEEEVQKGKEKSQDSTTPPEVEKSVSAVDWADVGRKFTAEKKRTPVWIIGLIILLLIAAVVGYFIYQRGLVDFGLNSESENVPASTTQTEQNDLNLTLPVETETPTSEETVSLDDTLFVTVYAANERLDPVRVWSDMKPRMDPYWLEQGTAMRFEFQDTIRIRGPFERMLLFKDGHRIDNPDANYYSESNDYVEITRSLFTDDPKWASSIQLELPEGIPAPDSITNRPTFP
jgi:transcriptional regulator with XRE-family HTH domain